jgi:hypothetical protein
MLPLSRLKTRVGSGRCRPPPPLSFFSFSKILEKKSILDHFFLACTFDRGFPA